MTATRISCPDCGEVSPCRVPSEAELRMGGSSVGSSGLHVIESQPEIKYRRRVRECGACGDLFVTAEVSELLLGELVESGCEMPGARVQPPLRIRQRLRIRSASSARRSTTRIPGRAASRTPGRCDRWLLHSVVLVRVADQRG